MTSEAMIADQDRAEQDNTPSTPVPEFNMSSPRSDFLSSPIASHNACIAESSSDETDDDVTAKSPRGRNGLFVGTSPSSFSPNRPIPAQNSSLVQNVRIPTSIRLQENANTAKSHIFRQTQQRSTTSTSLEPIRSWPEQQREENTGTKDVTHARGTDLEERQTGGVMSPSTPASRSSHDAQQRLLPQAREERESFSRSVPMSLTFPSPTPSVPGRTSSASEVLQPRLLPRSSDHLSTAGTLHTASMEDSAGSRHRRDAPSAMPMPGPSPFGPVGDGRAHSESAAIAFDRTYEYDPWLRQRDGFGGSRRGGRCGQQRRRAHTYHCPTPNSSRGPLHTMSLLRNEAFDVEALEDEHSLPPRRDRHRSSSHHGALMHSMTSASSDSENSTTSTATNASSFSSSSSSPEEGNESTSSSLSSSASSSTVRQYLLDFLSCRRSWFSTVFARRSRPSFIHFHTRGRRLSRVVLCVMAYVVLMGLHGSTRLFFYRREFNPTEAARRGSQAAAQERKMRMGPDPAFSIQHGREVAFPLGNAGDDVVKVQDSGGTLDAVEKLRAEGDDMQAPEKAKTKHESVVLESALEKKEPQSPGDPGSGEAKKKKKKRPPVIAYARTGRMKQMTPVFGMPREPRLPSSGFTTPRGAGDKSPVGGINLPVSSSAGAASSPKKSRMERYILRDDEIPTYHPPPLDEELASPRQKQSSGGYPSSGTGIFGTVLGVLAWMALTVLVLETGCREVQRQLQYVQQRRMRARWERTA